MSKKSKQTINSNLSSEFYVASLLFRAGYVATITFGNTKQVDIITYDPKTKKKVTIDVKGLKNTTNWVMPKKLVRDKHHFYILVTFKNKFNNFNLAPEFYVVPAFDVKKLRRSWTGRKDVKGIPYKLIKNQEKYKGENGLKLLFEKN